MERALAVTVMSMMLAGSPMSEPDGQFVVHEWGTFTSFAGSDGVQLEFRPLTGSDLPDFVYDRARQAGVAERTAGPGDKGRISGTQRMETPVTYFYTDREREIDVKVAFPQGLLTEFYPPVTAMSPPYVVNQPEALHDSSLHWASVHLLPSASATIALPAAVGDTHYGFARETESAFVRSGQHHEKFLFYRGVGNFSLPVKLSAVGGDRFTIETTLAEPISSAFLIDVEGRRVRFAQLSGIAAKREATLRDEASSLESLKLAMVDALTAAKLYPKEARAMVQTWESSWFGEEGTRLLYLLPTAVTDRILPLTVQPPPDQIVRVMVGRLEILTTERESRLEQELTLLETQHYPDCRHFPTLTRLGRFQEPSLRRIAAMSRDDRVRSAAEGLLQASDGVQHRAVSVVGD